MRWVNRQRRLFKRLNLIDACVAAIVVIILFPMIQFGYRVARLAEPEIRTVTPSTVKKNILSTIEINGKHFEKGSTVEMGPFSLRAEVVDSRKILAKVPPAIPVGAYIISVRNPNGVKGLMTGMLEVMAPAPPPMIISARSRKIKKGKGIRGEMRAEPVMTELLPKVSAWATFIASFEVQSKEAIKVVEESVMHPGGLKQGRVVNILSKKRRGLLRRIGFGRRRLIIARIAVHAFMYEDAGDRGDQAHVLFERHGEWIARGDTVTFQLRGQEFTARILTEPVGVSHSRLRVWRERRRIDE